MIQLCQDMAVYFSFDSKFNAHTNQYELIECWKIKLNFESKHRVLAKITLPYTEPDDPLKFHLSIQNRLEYK